MKTIRVNLSQNSYDVRIAKNSFAGMTKFMQESITPKSVFCLIDTSVLKLHRKKLEILLKSENNTIHFLPFKSTEAFKNFNSLQSILRTMLKLKFGRKSVFVAIGGGIVGDVGGFAASSYMRGIPFIQVPTTILSAVDSSIGGKTGINFGETKNSIGAFHQPKLVLIDTEFYKTLPEKEVICGLGEVVKYAYLASPQFFSYVNKNLDKIISLNDTIIQKIISDSVSFKANIVSCDEYELGLRSMLNLGHTFAHALEVEQKHGIKHGQAVIVGIGCSLYLSERLGLIDKSQLNTFISLIKRFDKFIKIKSVNKNLLQKIMTRDKKANNGEINFVLLKNIGEVVLNVKAGKADINYAIEKGVEIFK